MYEEFESTETSEKQNTTIDSDREKNINSTSTAAGTCGVLNSQKYHQSAFQTGNIFIDGLENAALFNNTANYSNHNGNNINNPLSCSPPELINGLQEKMSNYATNGENTIIAGNYFMNQMAMPFQNFYPENGANNTAIHSNQDPNSLNHIDSSILAQSNQEPMQNIGVNIQDQYFTSNFSKLTSDLNFDDPELGAFLFETESIACNAPTTPPAEQPKDMITNDKDSALESQVWKATKQSTDDDDKCFKYFDDVESVLEQLQRMPDAMNFEFHDEFLTNLSH